MTDNEIVQELLQIGYGGYWCINCRYARTRDRERCNLEDCNITRNALDLIKRQKAEIEQWKEEANRYQNLWCITVDDIKTAKSEAIKEFAKRLKEKKRELDRFILYDEDIDNLVKEMVGDSNAD